VTGAHAEISLALDHTGCIVRDLTAGAARWERLGLTLTPLSRQRGAVPGREGFQPWATANRCAILGHTYLELIGIVDAAAFNPWARFVERNQGLHICALRCDDADRAYAALSTRTDALQPPVPRERMLDVDGEMRAMRFRNIFSRDEHWPEARWLVIEHQTPEYLWQARYQRHENGARDLACVTFVADDPATLRPRLDALGATVTAHDARLLTGALPGGGTLQVMQPGTFADAYGFTPRQRTGMQAMSVAVADLNATRALLRKRAVPVRALEGAVCVLPEDANGCVLRFVQHEATA
jgi:hypothetical protein